MLIGESGKSGVEGQQQVERLLGPDLTDDGATRPHLEALLHQLAEPDLAGALQSGLAGLHGHPVRAAQDGPPDDQGQDGPDTFPAAVVNELRQENAPLRVKGKRSDALTSPLVEAMAANTGRLADPTDLPVTDDLLDDDGIPGKDKIEEAIEQLLKKKPHLVSTRPRYSDIGQGPRPGEQDVSLADILRAGA